MTEKGEPSKLRLIDQITGVDKLTATRYALFVAPLGAVVMDRHGLVQADGNGIDRSQIPADASASRLELEYEGVVNCDDCSEAETQQAADLLRQERSALEALIFEPWGDGLEEDKISL